MKNMKKIIREQDSDTDKVPTNYTFNDFLKAAKSPKDRLREIPKKDCKFAIQTFYNYAVRNQTDPNTDLGSFHDAAKQGVQTCVKQANMKRIIEKNIDGIGDMVRKLTGFNWQIPSEAKYRILREKKELNSLIKKTLKETKEQKNNKVIEKTLVKTRVETILENLEKFENSSKVRKVKIGFNFLKEASFLKKMNFLNEDLASVFKSLYGKSLDNTIQVISEPLMESIFTKIGLDEQLKRNVIENLKSKSSELLTNMENCNSLSKFITDCISEELAKKMENDNTIKSDLVNSSLMDTIKDDIFKQKLNSKLEIHICELFNKFTENAKNLVVRMSAL